VDMDWQLTSAVQRTAHLPSWSWIAGAAASRKAKQALARHQIGLESAREGRTAHCSSRLVGRYCNTATEKGQGSSCRNAKLVQANMLDVVDLAKE
jgi:hypothetical protein